MKSTTILALSAATLAAAQGNSSLSSLPTCGQYCINSLITKVQAAPYNCPNNPTCFCCKPDFGFGIRDCANESCGNSNDANSAIAYAASYCASALPTESTSACASFGGSASSTGSGSASSASATGSGTASAGGAGATGAAGAAGFIYALNGGASGYSIASTTATAGGPEVTVSGTEYSALPSDGGIVATASGATTTIPASALTGGAAASGSGSGSGAGALGFIAPVDGGSSGYSIASTTITAGGPEATLSNTEYSALPSAGGVVATASGLTTTYAESQLGGAGGAAGATGSSSGAPMSMPTSSGTGAGGAGGAGSSSTTHASSSAAGGAASSSSSGGAGAIITAAPVMVGAAALAVFAL